MFCKSKIFPRTLKGSCWIRGKQTRCMPCKVVVGQKGGNAVLKGENTTCQVQISQSVAEFVICTTSESHFSALHGTLETVFYTARNITQPALPLYGFQSSRTALRTSPFLQGCSSCPPADDLLKHVAKQGAISGVPVIPLVYHVDYWDHLGWTDPFGRKEWTERQRTYAEKLGEGKNVYTPQVVIQVREKRDVNGYRGWGCSSCFWIY